MSLKTVIIGAGGIAYRHAKALQEIGVEIVGVYDINKEAAVRFAATFGTNAIDSIEDILDKVDMADIYTPPSERVKYAEMAMNAGKHIFIEKPITVSLEDCDKILACAEKNNVKVIVGFNHRYREAYQMLQEAVLSGKLGEPINVYAHRFGKGPGFRGGYVAKSWRTDPKLVCGMSVESLSHDIDMLLGCVDGIKSVGAAVYCGIDGLPTFDNNSNVTFTLNNGGIGTINSSWSADIPYGARGIIGTKGTALIRGNGLWDFEEFVIQTEGMAYPQIYCLGDSFANSKSYVNIHSHFVDCIQNNKVPMTSGKQGRDALVISRSILESAASGRFVEVKNI